MYERNAIVLERYFDKTFSFNEINNLRVNYSNYQKLIENYEKYSIAIDAENKAVEEFNAISIEIDKLQKSQERLYNKGAKFEYSRYIIFNNIYETPENIEKCLTQVANDIEKNNNSLKELGSKFVSAVQIYNEKKLLMEKCQKDSTEAKKNFEEILEITKNCYNNIAQESILIAKEFISSENKDNKKSLVNIFTENGKNERNPFDTDVIVNAINVSISIYKIEIDIYLTGYDRTARFLDEFENDSVKIDKHKKFYNDSKLKLDFISAEKEYLIQFLDNERIAAIYDKKIHRKLMLEACRNLNSDLEQINKLYEIIQKEIAGRFTKKIYKENYNKEYLVNLENSSNEADFEQPKLRTNAIAVMNLNYWRIDGIKRIYEVFDRDISEIYNRDLSEFQPVEFVSEELEDNINDDEIKEEVISYFEKNVVEDVKEEIPIQSKKRKSKYGVLKSSKQVLANAIYISLQTHEFSPKVRTVSNEIEEINDQVIPDDEEYIDLDAKIASLDLLGEESDKIISEEENNIEQDKETMADDEESILDLYFKETDSNTEKRKEKDNKKLDKEIAKSGNIFRKIIGMNAKKKREA
jgi:hypothetical protein